MGYGHRDSSLLGFSWQHGIDDFAVCRSASRLRVDDPISQKGPPTRLPRDNHHPGSSILLRPPSAIRQQLGRFARTKVRTAPTLPLLDLARSRWYWNINQLCIHYASRPRVSSRLTLGGLAFPRNPWAFGGGVSHPSLATHACILTRYRSTHPHGSASQLHRRSSTARTCSEEDVRTHSFGSGLEPRYIVRAGSLDQ